MIYVNFSVFKSSNKTAYTGAVQTFFSTIRISHDSEISDIITFLCLFCRAIF